MKTIVTILLASASVLLAEDKIILPQLVATDGRVLLTNATFSSVIGKRVTFRTESGVPKAFDLSEISATNLQTCGVDVNAALAKQSALDEQKKVARAPLPVAAGEAKRVTVGLSNIQSYGGFSKCTAQIDDYGAKIILIHLPPALKNVLGQIEATKRSVAAQKAYADNKSENADRAAAVAPKYVSGDAAYVAAESAKMDRANLLAVEAKKETRILKEFGEQLRSLEMTARRESTFTARPTGRKYGADEIWEYVGPASEKRTLADR